MLPKSHKKSHKKRDGFDSRKGAGTFAKRNAIKRHDEPVVDDHESVDAECDDLFEQTDAELEWVEDYEYSILYPELDDTDYHYDGFFAHEDEGYESGDWTEI